MKPKMTVVIPILIQEVKPHHVSHETLLGATEKCLNCLVTHTKDPFNLLIIDYGSIKQAEQMIRGLNLPNLTYVRHEERARGIVDALNEAWKTTSTPLLALMHNDFYILETGWDREVYDLARGDPELGIIGFAGGYAMDPSGLRRGFASNMVDANVHGVHRWKGWMPAVVLDGMIMIMSRKMLDAVGGIPTEYKIHFFYDQHMSAASVFAGFHNYVLFIRCQHLSGQTLMAPDVDGMATYLHNKGVFYKRWSRHLPAYVTRDFTLAHGYPPRTTHEPHYFPAKPPFPLWRRR